jgi:hypothetical protein
MPLADLTPTERRIVRECLRAAVTGPFFPMREFPILFGLEHAEVADIAFGPDPLDDARGDVRLAINNALNMLTGYPHRQYDVWYAHVSAPPEDVRRILKKWKGTPTRHPFSADVFHELM